MRTALSFILLGTTAFALAACSEKEEAKRQETAGGEILARSVSDDMLPYDTLRSQPPLAPKPKANGAGPSTDESADEDGESSDDEAGAEPAQPSAQTTPAAE